VRPIDKKTRETESTPLHQNHGGRWWRCITVAEMRQTIDVANTYAKSLLRAVAQEWAAVNSNVDYFPSYEIVQSSDRAAVWETDLRHVKGAAAQHIMELLLEYLE
jgi:hypothetical protein